MAERLLTARQKVVGVKETTKAVQAGEADVLYVAADADEHIVKPVKVAAHSIGTEVVLVESMHALGRLCEIQVGAAVAALLASNAATNKRKGGT